MGYGFWLILEVVSSLGRAGRLVPAFFICAACVFFTHFLKITYYFVQLHPIKSTIFPRLSFCPKVFPKNADKTYVDNIGDSHMGLIKYLNQLRKDHPTGFILALAGAAMVGVMAQVVCKYWLKI